MTNTKTKPDEPIPFRCKGCGAVFVSQSQATFRCALCRCDKGTPILKEVNREAVTYTKTKPDGWVHKDWRTFMPECDVLVCREPWGFNVESYPVCLVPPALLDWCEEVEEFLKKTLDHCILNGYGEIASEERDLLNKLKEVRG